MHAVSPSEVSCRPNGVGAYYTPPGFMAIAGVMGSVGRTLEM